MSIIVVRTSIDLAELARRLKELGYIEITPRELAKLFCTNSVWARKILSKMEKQGLVERINSHKARPGKYRIL